MVSHVYSTDYDPAAPVLEVVVRAAGQEQPEVIVEALVDSGADGTILPMDVLNMVGAGYVETRRMRGLAGRALPVDLYLVTIRIGEHLIQGISAVGSTEGSEALLGRDVLNQLIVTLNGLAEVTEVSQ